MIQVHIIACSILLGLLFYSCSSGQVNIESIPKGAEIQAISSDGSISTLGVTPYHGKTLELFKSDEPFIYLRVSSPNFSSESILVEKPYWDKSVDLNLRLVRSQTQSNNSQSLEAFAKGLAEAQKNILSENYERADVLLTGMIKDFPDISVIYDYLGNANYLGKKFEKALYYYKKANQIEPNNRPRTRIIEKLEVITGGQNKQM